MGNSQNKIYIYIQIFPNIQWKSSTFWVLEQYFWGFPNFPGPIKQNIILSVSNLYMELYMKVDNFTNWPCKPSSGSGGFSYYHLSDQ